jgi:hypothetical protein
MMSLLGCGSGDPSQLRWSIEFACPEDAARTSYINLRVLADGCTSTDVVYETNLLRGKSAPTEVLAPGTYAFEVTAFDGQGDPVAGNCLPHDLPASQITVVLASADCDVVLPMDSGSPGGPVVDGSMPGNERDGGGSTDDSGVACTPATCPPVCALTANNCTCAQYNNHSYLFCPDAVDWAGARERCRAQMGDLVVIDTAEENAFIQSQSGASRWIGANDRGQNGHPGFSDGCPGKCNKPTMADEGVWKWVNAAGNNERGATFCEASEDSSRCGASGYMNWAPNEPNNADGFGCIPYTACGVGEDCAVMVGDGTWQDVSCDVQQAFICESF